MTYRYPDDSDAVTVKLKRLAARVGRTFHDGSRSGIRGAYGGVDGKHEKAVEKLRAYMNELDSGSLGYWARVAMIDGRWCGATGTGAFWAVASRVVNEIAQEILKERSREWKEKYGNAMFVAV